MADRLGLRRVIQRGWLALCVAGRVLHERDHAAGDQSRPAHGFAGARRPPARGDDIVGPRALVGSDNNLDTVVFYHPSVPPPLRRDYEGSLNSPPQTRGDPAVVAQPLVVVTNDRDLRTLSGRLLNDLFDRIDLRERRTVQRTGAATVGR